MRGAINIEQMRFAHELRGTGMSWEQIAMAIEDKYGVLRIRQSTSDMYYRWVKKYGIKPHGTARAVPVKIVRKSRKQIIAEEAKALAEWYA